MMNERLTLQSSAQSRRRNANSNGDSEPETNDDAVYAYSGGAMGLYLVCDGYGGQHNGSAASHLAVETIVEEWQPLLHASEANPAGKDAPLSATILEQVLQAAIKHANEKVWHLTHSGPASAKTMGSALTMTVISGDLAHIANVGHGRVYAWRAGQIQRLTQDDTLAAVLAGLGHIDETDIARHPRRKTLLRSLGQKEEITVDHVKWWLQPGDRLLLCSDGLWNAFPQTDELAEYLGAASAPATICRKMVAEAWERGGSDDISAVVVEVQGQSDDDGTTLWQKIVPTSVADRLALPH